MNQPKNIRYTEADFSKIYEENVDLRKKHLEKIDRDTKGMSDAEKDLYHNNFTRESTKLYGNPMIGWLTPELIEKGFTDAEIEFYWHYLVYRNSSKPNRLQNPFARQDQKADGTKNMGTQEHTKESMGFLGNYINTRVKRIWILYRGYFFAIIICSILLIVFVIWATLSSRDI